MKQYNYVYKITNLINGKIYIGKHSTDNLDDGYMGSSRRVKLEYSAIGKENFEKTILAYSNDENELADLERHYITTLNATDPDVGYNRQINSSRYSYTEEHKQKISQSLKGKHHSDETKRKMSVALKGKQTWLGKHHSEESRQKISQSMKGQKRSEETKRKMSESAKLAWQRRKQGV